MQGYLPVEASVLDVEVWGLGGETIKRQQNLYKKREDIFSEQRRKVLLRANLEPLAIYVIEMCKYADNISIFSFRLISKLLLAGKILQRK
jgi:hypothetical protein